MAEETYRCVCGMQMTGSKQRIRPEVVSHVREYHSDDERFAPIDDEQVLVKLRV